jgi:hypothetical protein
MTDDVIAAVHAMADKAGVKDFSLQDRNRVTLHPADWEAGVDYDDYRHADTIEDESDDEYESDSDSDDDSSSSSSDSSSSSSSSDSSDSDDDFDEADPNEKESSPIRDVVMDTGFNSNDEDSEQETAPTDAAVAEESDPEDQVPENANTTRSGRVSRPPSIMNISDTRGKSYMQTKKRGIRWADEVSADLAKLEEQHNLFYAEEPNSRPGLQYSEEEAHVLAMHMMSMMQRFDEQGTTFVQQYLLHEGLKKFGKSGHDAALKEIDQLHQRTCFEPISVKDLSPEEKARAMVALMFLAQKRDATIKGRLVYNGKPSREWLS